MSQIFDSKKDLTVHKNITIKESLSNQIEKSAKEHNMSYSKVINLILENFYNNEKK